VAITSRGLTVVEFLIGVSRNRDLGIRLRTTQSLTGSVDGVFRGASFVEALIRVQIADRVLTVADAVAP